MRNWRVRNVTFYFVSILAVFHFIDVYALLCSWVITGLPRRYILFFFPKCLVSFVRVLASKIYVTWIYVWMDEWKCWAVFTQLLWPIHTMNLDIYRLRNILLVYNQPLTFTASQIHSAYESTSWHQAMLQTRYKYSQRNRQLLKNMLLLHNVHNITT